MEATSANALLSLARAGFIFGGGVLVAVIVWWLLPRVVAWFYRTAQVEQWNRRVISAVALLVSAGVVIAAGYLAVGELPLTPDQRRLAAQISSSIVTALATLVCIRVVGLGFAAYIERRDLEGPPAAYLNLIRKMTQIAVLVVGILLILDQFHYRATALFASVGLASLGLGLALQDTMANFFAGIWLAMDRPITPGDFVELDSGQAGWVEEIGWRHCKLRTWDDTLLVVPNSRMASAVLINRSLPQPATSVYVACGVSYESDLDKVERLCIEVGREVQQTLDGAVTDWEPFVLFEEFADSNINFTVALRVRDPARARFIRSEFIKRLKARFDAEGIEINYPVRTVYLRGPALGQPPELTIRQQDNRPEQS